MSTKKTSSRAQLLREAKRIFRSLEAKARAEFPRTAPVQVKGILPFPQEGTPLDVGRNFSVVWITGSNRAGIYIMGGRDGKKSSLLGFTT